MKRHLLVLGLMTGFSLFAQDESKSSSHLFIYNDSKTGNWVPLSKQRSWIMTFSNEIGYRRDRQKFRGHDNQSVSYFHQFNTLLETTNLIFTWERVLIKLSADYGWLANGNLNYRSGDSVFSEPANDFPVFKMGSGYSADVKGSLGCRIKFWNFKNGSLSFIPALGYIYSHFNAYPEKQHRSHVPAIPLALPAGYSGYSSLEYSRPIQQDWFGPTAEGRIAFSWKEKWRFDFYYQYIPNNFRQTLEQTISNTFFSPPGTLVQANTVRERTSSKCHTIRTQLGGADISYRSRHHWELGTHFEGSSTWSNTGHSIHHVKTTSLFPSYSKTRISSREQLSVQWVRYATNVYCSYWF